MNASKYSREEALDRIRAFLVANMREDETTCEMAARLQVGCHGFDHWTTGELREMYPWLAAKLSPKATREQLIQLIVAWTSARCLVHDVQTTCDAMALDGDGCGGFNQFSNEQLKLMFPQLFNPEDAITGGTHYEPHLQMAA